MLEPLYGGVLMNGGAGYLQIATRHQGADDHLVDSTLRAHTLASLLVRSA
jgi:hypothetical protein